MKDDKAKGNKESARFSAVTQLNPVRHILVVDDDTDTRQLSIDVLVNAGFAVDFAINGTRPFTAGFGRIASEIHPVGSQRSNNRLMSALNPFLNLNRNVFPEI